MGCKKLHTHNPPELRLIYRKKELTLKSCVKKVRNKTEYLPFGETLVEEHLNSHNSPFKFNAKEFDAETGWYYYGARYYNPKWNLMLSVDQMAEKYPSFSPYAYTLQNPVRYTDPTGMTAEDTSGGCGCPPDCPTYYGGELEEVVIKAEGRPKNRTWSSETSIRDYGASLGQWEQDYGMKASDYTPEMAVAYNDWYNESAGEERLRAFNQRMKWLFYDTGVLQSSETVLWFAVGNGAAPSLGRGATYLGSKAFSGFRASRAVMKRAGIYTHVKGNAAFNSFKRSTMRSLSKRFTRSRMGFQGQRKLMNYGSGPVNFLKRQYKYTHDIFNTKTLTNTTRFILKHGSKFTD